MKIIIINQYRCQNNGEFPINLDLKQLGHDLIKLSNYIGINFESDSIHNIIIKFLNDFAKNSRYYNIDNILDKRKNEDPLNEWYNITQEILKKINKRKNIENKKALASMLDEISFVNLNHINGESLTSFFDLINEQENIEIIQQYSVQYMYEIISKLVEKIYNIERQKIMMPVLSEFFDIYYSSTMSSSKIRDKKDWTKK